MRPNFLGEIVIFLASNELLKQFVHTFLILKGETVAVQLIKMLLRKMLNIHVVISILSLPVLLFSIICVHDLDTFRPFNLLFLTYLLLFSLFGLYLLDNWVSKVQVRYFRQHKGW